MSNPHVHVRLGRADESCPECGAPILTPAHAAAQPRDTPHLDRDGDRWREHPSEARLAATDAGPRSESRSSGGWQGGPSGDQQCGHSVYDGYGSSIWSCNQPKGHEGFHGVLWFGGPQEHVTDSADPLGCWCGPYRDSEEPTVITHRKEGEA